MKLRRASLNSFLSRIGLTALVAITTAIGISQASATSLTGDSIQIYYLYPDAVTVWDTLGPVTAPASGPGDALDWQITGNQLILTTPVFGANFGAATFNGYEFVDLSRDPGITNVTVDASSTADLASISNISFTSNSVYFNYQGKSWGGSAVYDLTFAPSETPLPAALPLFASGLGIMGAARLWRKRKKAARVA